jgi:hypothetical protein
MNILQVFHPNFEAIPEGRKVEMIKSYSLEWRLL